MTKQLVDAEFLTNFVGFVSSHSRIMKMRAKLVGACRCTSAARQKLRAVKLLGITPIERRVQTMAIGGEYLIEGLDLRSF